jgi:hypothetical protein
MLIPPAAQNKLVADRESGYQTQSDFAWRKFMIVPKSLKLILASC